MHRSQITGFLILVLSIALFVWNAQIFTRHFQGDCVDFEAYYYASSSLLAHLDPYDPHVLNQHYLSSAGKQVYKTQDLRDVVIYYINLPTNLLVVAPLALLPLPAAFGLWSALTAACCCLACLLLWRTCAQSNPILCALLIFIVLASSGIILRGGNAVVLVASCSAIGAWCFIRERYIWAGVPLLALALILKPHEAGFIWLFFLLAGGACRRRALQTLAITVVLSLVAAVWAFRVSPNWPSELHANLVRVSTTGGMNDPGPGSSVDRKGVILVDMQTMAAIFCNRPQFYNPASYLVCGIPLLFWAHRVYRTSPRGNAAWLALAAVVPLSLLVTYHKIYDLQLLLLVLPACFLLWRENSTRGQAAFLLTAGILFFTTNTPLGVYYALTRSLPMDLSSFSGQLKAIFWFRPVPLLLSALAIFYLSVFLRQRAPENIPAGRP